MFFSHTFFFSSPFLCAFQERRLFFANRIPGFFSLSHFLCNHSSSSSFSRLTHSRPLSFPLSFVSFFVFVCVVAFLYIDFGIVSFVSLLFFIVTSKTVYCSSLYFFFCCSVFCRITPQQQQLLISLFPMAINVCLYVCTARARGAAGGRQL